MSPRSPAHQGPRWKNPAKYHEEAEQVDYLRKLGKKARKAGEHSYPRLKGVIADLEGQRLRVGYELERAPLRRASQLYVTVHDPEQPEVLLLSSAQPTSGRSGEVDLLLPRAVERCLVRASAFNVLRQRSDPLTAHASTGESS